MRATRRIPNSTLATKFTGGGTDIIGRQLVDKTSKHTLKRTYKCRGQFARHSTKPVAASNTFCTPQNIALYSDAKPTISDHTKRIQCFWTSIPERAFSAERCVVANWSQQRCKKGKQKMKKSSTRNETNNFRDYRAGPQPADSFWGQNDCNLWL